MKGLVYASLVLNKNYFITAGIVAAFGTALVSWLGKLLGNAPETADVISMFMVGMQFVVMAIVEEYLMRDFEKNLKSRFADYALAGMSKGKFVAAELLKNIISIVVSFVLVLLMQLVFMAVNPGIASADRIPFLAGLAIIIGLVDWVSLPLVVYLKSAEKAGLIVGLILGFGIIFPLMAVFGGSITEFLSGHSVLIWVPAAGAVIYALFYWVLLARIKRGDVC